MDQSIRPFTPEEAKASKVAAIPKAVIQIFNTFLSTRYTGENGNITITLNEVVAAVLMALKEEGEGYPESTRPYWCSASKNDLFENRWLDIEPVFEKAGWNVHYDKPGFNESYEATWTFSKKK